MITILIFNLLFVVNIIINIDDNNKFISSLIQSIIIFNINNINNIICE